VLLATAWLRHSLRRRSGVRADTRRLGELPRSVVEHHRANGDTRPLRGLQAHRLPKFETATTRTTRAIRLRVSGKVERADSGKHCKHYGASAKISQRTVYRHDVHNLVSQRSRCRGHSGPASNAAGRSRRQAVRAKTAGTRNPTSLGLRSDTRINAFPSSSPSVSPDAIEKSRHQRSLPRGVPAGVGLNSNRNRANHPFRGGA